MCSFASLYKDLTHNISWYKPLSFPTRLRACTSNLTASTHSLPLHTLAASKDTLTAPKSTIKVSASPLRASKSSHNFYKQWHSIYEHIWDSTSKLTPLGVLLGTLYMHSHGLPSSLMAFASSKNQCNSLHKHTFGLTQHGIDNPLLVSTVQCSSGIYKHSQSLYYNTLTASHGSKIAQLFLLSISV